MTHVILSRQPIGGVFRVLDSKTGKVANNSTGKPLDGGGHMVADTGYRQVQYINQSIRAKAKIRM